jgi:Uma2 family endonuclease
MFGSGPKRRATYQDVLDAPPHVVAEIIGGQLRLSPRPGGPHMSVASALGEELGPPFRRGRGGPGGWIILDEPELHLEREIVIPDLAGWRRERLPRVPNAAYFTLAPDWLCEILSRSTEKLDRADKLPIYAAYGVRNVWLVNPLQRTLEVLRLHDGKWLTLAVHCDEARVRAEPFDAIELDLADLWADLEAPPPREGTPSRASEPMAVYGDEYFEDAL